MISRLRKMFGRTSQSSNAALRFSRPIVIFQSDDWGRVGVCDRQGWDQLCAQGMNLREKPYDFYSLETPDDLHALSDVLRRHRDSVGRHPCIGMNFVMANIDFHRSLESSANGVNEISFVPLTEGFPEPWQRPGLIDAYLAGIGERLFCPALHGLTHFCAPALERELGSNGERSQLLKTLWQAGTPYIHWRMPWIGYEYWDPALLSDQRFLPLSDQRAAIRRAAEIYRAVFASIPLSACAPGYRANEDTKTAWFEAGVRVVQGGPGEQCAPTLDENGMLSTFRNVEMEPATAACDLNQLITQANECLSRGWPAVVSIHSINFHSTIRDFRSATVSLLDGFLAAMEKRWPDLVYMHDGELWQIATQGFLEDPSGKIEVQVTPMETERS